jgi:antitoxin component of RelBE/YafQ-DinJ toxin-antitoxin module
MARKVKDDYIGGRVDTDFKEQVEQYIDDAGMTQGELVRVALEEYMRNHTVTEE